MAKYLFRFGFCTPVQWKANEEHGWDDESSKAFFVEAATLDCAESWGCEVAEAFCYRLFKKAGWDKDIPSWKDSGFAFWIETQITSFPIEYLNNLPVVLYNQMPDLAKWESNETS
jgi:hypothetical protein